MGLDVDGQFWFGVIAVEAAVFVFFAAAAAAGIVAREFHNNVLIGFEGQSAQLSILAGLAKLLGDISLNN